MTIYDIRLRPGRVVRRPARGHYVNRHARHDWTRREFCILRRPQGVMSPPLLRRPSRPAQWTTEPRARAGTELILGPEARGGTPRGRGWGGTLKTMHVRAEKCTHTHRRFLSGREAHKSTPWRTPSAIHSLLLHARARWRGVAGASFVRCSPRPPTVHRPPPVGYTTR